MRLMNCMALPLVLAVAGVAQAQEEKSSGLELTIGDEAPKLDIAHWIKGGPEEGTILEFEDDQIYVVEFWATWCGPCRASMPHISELQEKLKDYDVTIIGVSNEPLQTVASFLVERDDEEVTWWDKTRYTLVTDPDASVFNDYMKAAGQRFIPTAFIVGKEGHIEWIGSPRDIDPVLEDVVHDRWDRSEYKNEFESRMGNEVKVNQLQTKLRDAARARDWETVHEAYDELIALGKGYESLKVEKFLNYIGAMNDPQTGYAYGEKIVKEHWDDPMLLNRIAWEVVDTDGIQTRDLEFAMKAAKRANELTDSEDGAILDTLARVYYEMGDLENALKYQRMAVEHATDQFRGDLEAALEKYEKEAKAKR